MCSRFQAQFKKQTDFKHFELDLKNMVNLISNKLALPTDYFDLAII